MEKTLELFNEITIDEKKVKELKYDIDEIDNQLYMQAEKVKGQMFGAQANINSSTTAELDKMSHLYAGYAAIIAKNRRLDFSDLEQIKGRDIPQVQKIGRNFYIGVED